MTGTWVGYDTQLSHISQRSKYSWQLRQDQVELPIMGRL
jgi:hypothetical protein